MKHSVSFLVAFFFCFRVFAQGDITRQATEYITAKKYPTAIRYLDSILKKNPREIDALMMKGNVLLNRSFDTLPNVLVLNDRTESIFDTSITVMQPGVKILPAATVLQVEKLWKQCLAIDSTRTDIRQGLCQVYAMALMKEKLKTGILQLLKHDKNKDEEQPYKIADYARKFKERGRFDDAIEIYQFIARQYPNLGGIRSDIAWEFFYEGKIKEALQYIDSALNKPYIDESTYLNSAFAYSELGYFDNALDAFAEYSKKYNTKMDVFYRGLMLYSQADTQAIETLQNFTSSVDSNAYYDEYHLALGLLTYTDTLTLENLQQIINSGYPDWYMTLIYHRAMNDMKGNCQPLVRYGLYQNSIKNYPASVQYLEDGEGCEMLPEQKEKWLLNYAYALYITGEKQKSLPYFKQLFPSTNAFTQQAAKYFTAKVLLEQKKTAEAKNLLNAISASKEKTKYGELSRYLVK